MNTTLSAGGGRPRRSLSLSSGNAIQLVGVAAGIGLLWLSARSSAVPLQVAAMIAGYLLIYFTSHSLSHYLAGRLAGIRFVRYSLGGSAHASAYPAGMRFVFERLPFFAVHSDPQSLKTARPAARALMFAAGITGTVLFCTLAAWFAYRAHVPGGLILLIFNVVWLIGSWVTETRPGGDLAKARSALRPAPSGKN